MSRQDQINLLKRLLHYVETRTTAMADSPWRNEVSAYTDAERLAEEQRVLFRKHPLVMGFASDWPAPGNVCAFVTTRSGGVSTGRFATMNLGRSGRDEPAALAANRRRLGLVIGLFCFAVCAVLSAR